MSETSTEFVTIKQVGEAIRKCCKANPKYGAQKLLHPDAVLLCERFAEMNYRKLSSVKRSTFQGEHLEALIRWIE